MRFHLDYKFADGKGDSRKRQGFMKSLLLERSEGKPNGRAHPYSN